MQLLAAVSSRGSGPVDHGYCSLGPSSTQLSFQVLANQIFGLVAVGVLACKPPAFRNQHWLNRKQTCAFKQALELCSGTDRSKKEDLGNRFKDEQVVQSFCTRQAAPSLRGRLIFSLVPTGSWQALPTALWQGSGQIVWGWPAWPAQSLGQDIQILVH